MLRLGDGFRLVSEAVDAAFGGEVHAAVGDRGGAVELGVVTACNRELVVVERVDAVVLESEDVEAAVGLGSVELAVSDDRRGLPHRSDVVDPLDFTARGVDRVQVGRVVHVVDHTIFDGRRRESAAELLDTPLLVSLRNVTGSRGVDGHHAAHHTGIDVLFAVGHEDRVVLQGHRDVDASFAQVKLPDLFAVRDVQGVDPAVGVARDQQAAAIHRGRNRSALSVEIGGHPAGGRDPQQLARAFVEREEAVP